MVYYSNDNQSELPMILNSMAHTFLITSHYTLSIVYNVTAVRLIGGTSRALEGMKSKTITRRTLTGGK